MKNYQEEYERLLQQMCHLRKDLNGPMEAFRRLHREALLEKTLDKKTKELIALGIGIAVRCDGCTTTHIHDALGAGATRDEILETIGVAILMGGGPSVMYGLEAFEAMTQFEKERQKMEAEKSLYNFGEPLFEID